MTPVSSLVILRPMRAFRDMHSSLDAAMQRFAAAAISAAGSADSMQAAEALIGRVNRIVDLYNRAQLAMAPTPLGFTPDDYPTTAEIAACADSSDPSGPACAGFGYGATADVTVYVQSVLSRILGGTEVVRRLAGGLSGLGGYSVASVASEFDSLDARTPIASEPEHSQSEPVQATEGSNVVTVEEMAQPESGSWLWWVGGTALVAAAGFGAWWAWGRR